MLPLPSISPSVKSAGRGTLSVLLDEGDQALREPCLEQKGMIQKFLCRCSFQWLPRQHPFQEVSQNWRGPVEVFQFGRRTVPEPLHCLDWRITEIGGFSIHHLYHHDPQRPDVHLSSVWYPCNNFWSHPVGSTYQGLSFRYIFTDLSTETKI